MAATNAMKIAAKMKALVFIVSLECGKGGPVKSRPIRDPGLIPAPNL